jgi:WhiB family redox-sensing transcriptional regulator
MNELYLIDARMLEESDAVSTRSCPGRSARCAPRPTPRRSSPKRVAPPARPRRSASGATCASECLEYALANDERFGIWGGLSERERRKLKKRAV